MASVDFSVNEQQADAFNDAQRNNTAQHRMCVWGGGLELLVLKEAASAMNVWSMWDI